MFKTKPPEPNSLQARLLEYTSSKGNFSSDFFIPLGSESVFKLAGHLFGSIPQQSYYKSVTHNSVVEFLIKNDYEETIYHDTFDKEIGRCKPSFRVFTNLNDLSILCLKIGKDEDEFDFFEKVEGNDEKMVSAFHFYDREMDSLKLKKLSDVLAAAAMEQFKIKVKKNSINFLCHNSGGFHLKNIKMKKKANIDLELNYGEAFVKIHDNLVKFLDSEDTGLAILNGIYGSGKSYYIRHLLSILNKRVIYIPPHLIQRVAEPDFLAFLLEESDFILVIEDAEEIITNRKDIDNTAGVSNLLNLSDGILGECIKVKIITTFNAKIDSIDPALLRKGRLKIRHEFLELPVDATNKLFKHLGINHESKIPMAIGNIYGFNEVDYNNEKVKDKIGFSK